MAFLAAGVAGCGGTQRPVSDPRPEPGEVVSTLFDAGSVYSAMGLLVAGAPLPFVATLDYMADATPDSTLAVFSLSLSNHALTFQRDGTVFTAHYHVEVTFRVMGPMDDHDHLMKHMLQDAGVHRFSRS